MTVVANLKRSTTAERLDGAPPMWQIKYWDPQVRCWCDYGDPVPADQRNAKFARCQQGLTP